MTTNARTLIALGLAFIIAAPAAGQNAPASFRDEAMHHFEASSNKIVQLARAMPESLYTWSPMEGVMPVAQVYMHIARYNYLYLSRELGLPLPPHIELSTMEAVTDKATVTEALEASVDYVRRHVTNMGERKVSEMTTQYGRNIAGWAVLFALVAHMNEHVGQSVAYARMNGIVPPWSM